MVGETKPISKIIIEAGGDEYVFSGGGGGSITPGVPIPADTVDTNAIIDGAVEMQDLNQNVKDKMTNHYDAQGEGIVLGGLVANNSQDVGQGGSEDSDDDETGFENNADNGSDDI
jgi:hypothetical protein